MNPQPEQPSPRSRQNDHDHATLSTNNPAGTPAAPFLSPTHVVTDHDATIVSRRDRQQKDGTWRLNAVEYVIPARDLPGTATPPELFGQKFTFYPEVGAAGIWGLHVWLWRHNPRGMFVNLNPLVSCQYADTVGP